MKVIRCGHRDPRKELPYMTAQTAQTLQGFWELEEQLGIRKRPEDNILNDIPKIRPSRQADE